MRRWLCLLLLQTGMATAQEPLPLIREITFSGNDTTKPKVMLREMSVHVGDAADPGQIERSRQAVQDLGLFKSVQVRQEPLSDGVRLVYIVDEKFFLLPYPRLNANVDRQYSYGAELEWNNLLGLNHSLRLIVSRSDANREGYGKQTSYFAGYSAPFIADTHNNLGLSFSHSTTPMFDVASGKAFIETQESAQALMSHTFSTTAASQGWSVGGGALYQHEDRYGPGAAPPYGDATAAVGVLEYRDLHFKIYSEEGSLFSFRHESAIRGLASDYGYTALRASYDRYMPVGEREHQTLQIATSIGASYSGPQDVQRFSLGGGAGLLGYPRYSFNGNSYYYLAGIFQRPVGWDWLRLLAAVELGNTAEHANSALFRNVYADVALGLRLRVSWFIDLQFEAGWALPLNGSSSGRFFGRRL
jgi:outer membrane protein assembly factor BamA